MVVLKLQLFRHLGRIISRKSSIYFRYLFLLRFYFACLVGKIEVLINVPCQAKVVKAKKKLAEENKEKALKVTLDKAENALSDGKAYCVVEVNVGSDTSAIRDAAVEVSKQKVVFAAISGIRIVSLCLPFPNLLFFSFLFVFW